jgi:hypothetical protein
MGAGEHRWSSASNRRFGISGLRDRRDKMVPLSLIGPAGASGAPRGMTEKEGVELGQVPTAQQPQVSAIQENLKFFGHMCLAGDAYFQP